MRINFVMSNNVASGIFNAIIGNFKRYMKDDNELFVTEHPLPNMDVYHYHRPNLEASLMKNSVVTVHHDLEDTDPWFDSSTFVEKYHEASSIICLNKKQSNFLLLEEELDNTVIIPHGIDKSIFSDAKKIKVDGEKLTLGIVSKRYGRRVKGEALLLELYKRLNSDSIKFVFVGHGRTEDAVLAKSYGFEADCFEDLPYSLFNNLYSSMDILLVPSLFEGGPANIPEAFYTNTPVIGRNIAMISDMIKEGKNGFFLTGNPFKDANLINDLANLKNNKFQTLLDNINSYDQRVLSWEDVVLKHISLYQSIINKNKEQTDD